MLVISEREPDKRIQQLKDEGVHLYSFSMLSTINQCLYDAWATYVAHDRGLSSAYAEMGTCLHEITEDVISGTAQTSDMPHALKEGLVNIDMLGLNFPKDFRGEDSIRTRWIADMEHFCKTFYPPKGEYDVEKLLIYRISPTRAIRGYADLIRKNADKTVSVFDLKTSSNYKQEDLLEHGRQLTIYGMALEQEGYTVKSTAWIMMKYVELRYDWYATKRSKAKTPLVKVVNRSKIYETLREPVLAACRSAGMDEPDIDIAMMDFANTNIMSDQFPEEVRGLFSIKPYVRNYPFTKELKEEALAYIDRTADLYESLDQNQDEPWPSRTISKDCEFFCHMLCGHRNTCPHIKEYDRLNAIPDVPELSDDDLF